MKTKPRLLRITTVPISLKLLLEGQFTFFQQHGFEVLTVSANGPEVNYLKNNQVKHRVVTMTRAITPLRDLYALWKLLRVIKRFKPHIVHTHTPKAGLLGMIAAWIYQVPIRMHTVSGLPLMEEVGFKRWVLIMTERITYACANHVYPNSRGLLEYITSQITTPDSKFKIIGRGSSNGIDASYFSRTEGLQKQAKSIREQYDIPIDTIVFSFVGRVVKDKGIVELVEAFRKITNTVAAKLMLIGPFEENLDPLPTETIAILKNDKNIIVTGFQHDVRSWMLASDVFVFPSYREGFPNVVMQAACLGIPVIASNINGCNEIIEHGETGVLVPAKNTDTLYKAMLELASDKAKRLNLSRNSREFVVRNFDRHFVWGGLLNEYRSTLEKSGYYSGL